MRSYKRLCLEDRQKVESLRTVGVRTTEIASILNRHKSTISRELARCRSLESYRAIQAENRYNANLSRNKKKVLNANLRDYLISKLTVSRWSPGAIAGRLKNKSYPRRKQRGILE